MSNIKGNQSKFNNEIFLTKYLIDIFFLLVIKIKYISNCLTGKRTLNNCGALLLL